MKMDLQETHKLMRKAVLIAKTLEGSWSIRMKIALDIVIINHYLKQPLSKGIIERLLLKGVSLRRIKKHYKVGMKEINSLMTS
ncbi:MAG: hypothetical protein ACQEWR_05745 [Bacillota bacterium]